MGRYFDAAFEDLGGSRVYKAGEGNSEFQQTEEQFEAWKEHLWRDLCSHFEASNSQKGQLMAKTTAVKVDVAEQPLTMVFGGTPT